MAESSTARAFGFIGLRTGIDGQAGGMDLIAIHAQCAGGSFNFDLLAALVHADMADEHAGD